MPDIAQLSLVAQFLFFVGCGYLALQLPFGWVAMILGLLLTKGIPLSGGSVWGAPLNSPSMWMTYLVVLGLLIGLGFAFWGNSHLG